MEKQSIHSKDSYTERRKLFKNIWDTAVKLDEKDKESEQAAVAKPKVIKTLRLGESDEINVGKNKKQRIKNLRIVCNRLLDICNKQESIEEQVYDQMSAARHDSSVTSTMGVHQRKRKKKTTRTKKKAKKNYQLPKLPQPPPVDIQEETASFNVDEDGAITHRGTKPLRDLNSLRMERALLIERFLAERLNLQNVRTPEPGESEQKLGDAHRKVVKKSTKNRRNVSATPSPEPRGAGAARRLSPGRQCCPIPIINLVLQLD
ncbi:uncharacterized protein LOC125229184 [Leguminivora glycinivorella]|uniref:uncharacterized protein LOC125229184 n=1 Tax=Leguminivora glycinivorella TaxID=1035111 RepID=UPI00200D6622|nr:uncharacterized protein LOC125229184 [Leguminivora glycinivorella]